MVNQLVEKAEQSSLRKEPLKFDVGDTVDVATRIIEGDKERIQVFSGTVIARKGRGVNETFIVRRIVNNEGVERIFPTNSPNIASVTVKRSGESRRSKLYYLRDRVGKSVRLVEKRKDKREEGTTGAKAEPKKEAALAASAS